MHTRALGIALLAVAACGGPSTTMSSLPRPAPFDLIVRGGSVLDGTGRPAYRADVGVAGARIAKVGDLSRDTAATVIDASGLVVAPGFINIHSHASALPTAANMLTQGVTTELLNPDGGGPLDIARQLVAAESGSLAVNVGVYAPFNPRGSASWARRPAADAGRDRADHGAARARARGRRVGRVGRPRLQAGVLRDGRTRSSPRWRRCGAGARTSRTTTA